MRTTLQYIFLFSLACIIAVACSKESITTNQATNTGQGGSTARFTIVGDYMYTVDQTDLYVFRLSEPENPIFETKVPLGVGIETIFPHNGKLFIGANSGMYIYDITTNPLNPNILSLYNHVTACDPVVANDSVAFVTLRSGQAKRCETTLSNSNVLETVDISPPWNPQMIRRFNMDNPYGLGLDGNLLFVCDASKLKVLDASNPAVMANISSLAIDVNDVIPLGDTGNGMRTLLAVGEKAVYDIDYSDPNNLRIVKKINRMQGRTSTPNGTTAEKDVKVALNDISLEKDKVNGYGLNSR